jgi:hypothetical protein
VERLLEVATLPGGHWLEPAVGGSSIVQVVDRHRSDVIWTTVDVRPGAEADLTADFLALGCPELDLLVPEGGSRGGWAWDVAITNPPYSDAEAFVQTAMVEASTVVMLLRLGFLSGSQRSRWLRSHMPAEVWVLPNRPSFVGGRTATDDYAWMIWRGPWFRAVGDIRILRSTPLCERRRI